MDQPYESQSPLRPEYAFVVQFRTEADLVQERVIGRIEHITSGEATHFASWAELHTFFARVLPAQQAAAPESTTKEQS